MNNNDELTGVPWPKDWDDGTRQVESTLDNSLDEEEERYASAMEAFATLHQQKQRHNLPVAVPACLPIKVTDKSLKTLADYRSRTGEITWLWDRWIPNGHVTLLAAAPGIGKSMLGLHFVKLAYHGGQWPDGQLCEPVGRTLWLDTESALALTADRIKKWQLPDLMDAIVLPFEDEIATMQLDNPEHQKRIIELAGRPDIGLVIVDSLSGGHRLDENSTETGALIRSLAKVAEETSTPVLVIHHFNKAKDKGISIDRLRGNSAIAQYPRSIIALHLPDPTHPAELCISSIKSSMSKRPDPMRMTITEKGLEFGADIPQAPQQQTKINEAEDFLREQLADGNRVWQSDIIVRATDVGMCKRTLDQAKKNLGIISQKDGSTGKWYWQLPQPCDAEDTGEPEYDDLNNEGAYAEPEDNDQFTEGVYDNDLS